MTQISTGLSRLTKAFALRGNSFVTSPILASQLASSFSIQSRHNTLPIVSLTGHHPFLSLIYIFSDLMGSDRCPNHGITVASRASLRRIVPNRIQEWYRWQVKRSHNVPQSLSNVPSVYQLLLMLWGLHPTPMHSWASPSRVSQLSSRHAATKTYTLSSVVGPVAPTMLTSLYKKPPRTFSRKGSGLASWLIAAVSPPFIIDRTYAYSPAFNVIQTGTLKRITTISH